MDVERFDAWTTRLTAPRSRRLTLKAAAAGVLALGLGRGGAAAACVEIGKKCKGQDGKAKNCCGGAKCHGKRCRCVNPKQNSGGVCAKKPHCRRRGAACTTDSVCCSGSCGFFGEEICNWSIQGERCLNDADCFLSPNFICVGFRCREQP